MTKQTENNFRAIALAPSAQKVGAVTRKIEESFARRDTFESEQGLNVKAKNSYTTERDRMLKNKVAVARLMLACDVEPSAVIERRIGDGMPMFNAKALKKVTEIAQLTSGKGARLEKVLKAFIACTIVATERGATVVNNRTNMSFIDGRADLSAVISDQDTLDAIDSLSGDSSRHTGMTSGAATQSSQVRNVLDALKIGEIRTTDKARDAIALDLSHGFVDLFKSEYMSA